MVCVTLCVVCVTVCVCGVCNIVCVVCVTLCVVCVCVCVCAHVTIHARKCACLWVSVCQRAWVHVCERGPPTCHSTDCYMAIPDHATMFVFVLSSPQIKV